MFNHNLFTSESVSPGHPDKIADQIADAILDAVLEQDREARVACETLVKFGMAFVAGEITTSAWVDIESIARKVIAAIGYNDPALGFEASTCAVISAIGKQSPDIALGVDASEKKPMGAGDQGMMFGFACNETPTLMPAPIYYAHLLMAKQAELLHKKTIPWLRPDAKSQVGLRYENGKPVEVLSVVVSTQHAPDVAYDEVVATVKEQIIKAVLPSAWLTENTKYYVNPTGRFVMGGPIADCGLTGRKIIVDTYGGMARHGGGCFSGKDASKVDRSAAYAARYVAKNIVAAGLVDRCELQLAYAIGVAEPLTISVNTFGGGKISDAKIIALVREHFDLTPAGIIKMLDLKRPIYLKTAALGHFGREEPEFTWERTDKAEALRRGA